MTTDHSLQSILPKIGLVPDSTPENRAPQLSQVIRQERPILHPSASARCHSGFAGFSEQSLALSWPSWRGRTGRFQQASAPAGWSRRSGARLLSPYREHLAKHFADIFSHIALPEPYNTPS